MKTNFYIVLRGCMLFFACANVGYAQLPYSNTASSADEFSQFGESGKVNFSPYGAELTTKEKETNGVFLDEVLFSSTRGFIVAFDYLMTGVGGNRTDKGANGLALVLFDASVKNPTLGSKTAGLGYSYSKAENSSLSVPGLTKGFLSIGLDLYGDFKERAVVNTAFRNGIYTTTRQSNHITVRGQGDKLEGYPVYLSQSLTNINERYKLNIQTGEYITNFEAPDSKGFSFKLRENDGEDESDIQASFGHPSYRRVIVSVLPSSKLRENGFYLNVDIIHGSETSRVIDSFFIPSEGVILYQEASTKTTNTLKEKRINTPALFKIGFTATTGALYQKNIIRNIRVRLPFAPLVQDVLETNACKDNITSIDVLEHSVGFATNKYVNGQDLALLGNKEHLDPYSFQFLRVEEDELINTLEPFVATTTAGRYEYNPHTMKVVFIPKKGMTAREDQVYFSVKNKPKMVGNTDLGGEQYRSENAKIELKFTHNCDDVILINGKVL